MIGGTIRGIEALVNPERDLGGFDLGGLESVRLVPNASGAEAGGAGGEQAVALAEEEFERVGSGVKRSAGALVAKLAFAEGGSAQRIKIGRVTGASAAARLAGVLVVEVKASAGDQRGDGLITIETVKPDPGFAAVVVDVGAKVELLEP